MAGNWHPDTNVFFCPAEGGRRTGQTEKNPMELFSISANGVCCFVRKVCRKQISTEEHRVTEPSLPAKKTKSKESWLFCLEEPKDQNVSLPKYSCPAKLYL